MGPTCLGARQEKVEQREGHAGFFFSASSSGVFLSAARIRRVEGTNSLLSLTCLFGHDTPSSMLKRSLAGAVPSRFSFSRNRRERELGTNPQRPPARAPPVTVWKQKEVETHTREKKQGTVWNTCSSFGRRRLLTAMESEIGEGN